MSYVQGDQPTKVLRPIAHVHMWTHTLISMEPKARGRSRNELCSDGYSAMVHEGTGSRGYADSAQRILARHNQRPIDVGTGSRSAKLKFDKGGPLHSCCIQLMEITE